MKNAPVNADKTSKCAVSIFDSPYLESEERKVPLQAFARRRGFPKTWWRHHISDEDMHILTCGRNGVSVMIVAHVDLSLVRRFQHLCTWAKCIR